MSYKRKLLLLLSVISSNHIIAATDTDIIKQIKISGLDKIQPDFIEQKLIKELENQTYSTELFNQVKLNLLMTELFDTVDLKYEDGILEIILIERPIIKSIKIQSEYILDKLFGKDLINKILAYFSIAEGLRLKESTLNTAREGLNQQLIEQKKNLDVQVSLSTERTEANQVNIIVDIKCGSPITVQKVILLENKAFSEDTLLSACVNEIPSLLNIFGFKEVRFSQSWLLQIKEQITNFYQERGFLDIEILSNEIIIDEDKNAYVYITISEGNQYFISNIRTTHNYQDPEFLQSIESLITIEPGTVFQSSKVTEMLAQIKEFLDVHNWVGSQVEYQILKGDKNVDIIIGIDRGYYKPIINRTRIYSDAIATNVVLAKLLQREGDDFNFKKHRTFLVNMRNLPIVEKVSSQLKLMDNPQYVDLIYNITASGKRATSLGLTFNYSSSKAWGGFFNYSDLNFLNTAATAKFSIGINNLGLDSSISVDVNNIWPYINGSFGIGIVQIKSSDQEYYRGVATNFNNKKDKIQGSVGLSVDSLFDIPSRLSLDYKIQQQIFNIKFNPSNYLERKQLLGKSSLLSNQFILSFASQQKDRSFLPTQGFAFNVSSSLKLQDNFWTWGLSGTTSFAFSPFKWSSLNLQVSAEYVKSLSQDREIFQEDFLQGGGLFTARGFADGSLGSFQRIGERAVSLENVPLNIQNISFSQDDQCYYEKDNSNTSTTRQNQPVKVEVAGGDLSIFGRAEMVIPINFNIEQANIVTPYMTLFLDAGNVFYTKQLKCLTSNPLSFDNIRISSGIQFNFPTTIIGTFKVGLAFPLKKQQNDLFTGIFIGITA